MEIKTLYAQDLEGNVIPEATVYIYERGTFNTISGLQDAAGQPLSNPFTADLEGRIIVAAPTGTYDMRVTDGAKDRTRPIQFLDAGYVNKRIIYVGSVAELEGLTPFEGQVAYLSFDGRSGEFVFVTGDRSANVSSDPQQGIWIAPDFDPTGASGAWLRRYNGLTNQAPIYLSWFGALANGTTDDTTAINAAVNYANGKRLKIKASTGRYLYGGGADLSEGVVIEGEGRNATTILARDANVPYLFNAVGYGSGLRALRFEANVTQTGGKWVWLQGGETFIDDFYMDGDFNGVYMTGNVSRIRHGRFQDGASGAIRIISEGGDNSQIIDDVLMGAQLPQVSFAGIRVRNSSALMITNTSVIQQGIGLLIDPVQSAIDGNPTNGNVFSLFVSNCFFDNSGNNGIRIAPSGDASVLRCRFSDVWCGSSANDGVSIENRGTGSVSGLQFNSLHAFLNGGSGLTTGAVGAVSDIEINGGSFAQNAYGMFIDGVNKLKITNATVGASSGLSGNSSGGITIGSAVDNFIIANNIILGNSGLAVNDTATGATKVVRDNIGYVTSNGGEAAVTTDVNGLASIAHGLDVTPNNATVFVSGDTSQEATIISLDSTNINIRVRNTTSDADLASGLLGVIWSAKRG